MTALLVLALFLLVVLSAFLGGYYCGQDDRLALRQWRARRADLDAIYRAVAQWRTRKDVRS